MWPTLGRPALGHPRQFGHGQLGVLFPLGGLGEPGELGAVHGQRRDVGPRLAGVRGGPLHGPPLDVQEPDQDLYGRVVPGLGQALGLRRRRLERVHRGVGGRHQHAELEPDLVLLR